MEKTNFNFSLTKEAFLLSSLQEVVKVWARGSGQASFNLNIHDGVAELQLGFKLGSPSELHCHGPPLQEHQQEEQHHQQPCYPHHRLKGQGRRRRDHQRAQQFKAALATKQDAPAVRLPFTGKLLPVTKPPNRDSLSPSEAASSAAPTPPTTAATTSSPAAPLTSPVLYPHKPTQLLELQ